MSSGLYGDIEIVERFQASVSAANLAQPFLVPVDLEIIGMMIQVGTAPGASDGVTVNISDSPTSQLANVSAYNLWTATNVPTISGTGVRNFTTSTSLSVVENRPYPVNYPLPGPSGTTGYATAQATAKVTSTPVVTPPLMYEYQMGSLVAPDNTYTDFNGFTGVPANIVHAGDVLTFVVAASGSGLGSTANLAISLLCAKN
jgi:hypothetical protein